MRLLDLAFACAMALWLTSGGLGQDPGFLFEPGAGTPAGQIAPLNRGSLPMAFRPGASGYMGQMPPLDSGVMQVAYESNSQSPLRPTTSEDVAGTNLDFEPGSGSPLRQVPPPSGNGVDITVRPPDLDKRRPQEQPPRQQQQEVSPVTFTWRDTVEEKADDSSPHPLRPAPGRDLPSSPGKAPGTLTAAAKDGEILYSREGVVYSKDGYYFLNPGSNRVPGASPDAVRIDRNCAAYRLPDYDLVIEPLLWRLENVRSRPLALNPGLGTVTRSSDLDLGMSIGTRVKVDYLSDESENISGFEVVYTGVYDLNDDLTIVAPPATFLRLPDTLGNVGETVDFAAADSMSVHHGARLNSAEASLIFGQPAADFHVLVGLRYIRLEESFRLNAFTADRLSTYEVDTMDALWGAQIGGLWHRSRGCWELTSFLKLGVYNNNAEQATLLTDNDRTVVLRDFRTGDTVDSFVMDAGLNAARWINDKWLIRAGYGVLWLNNVARAPDQLDFSSNAVAGSRIFYRQDALAHGLNFGLEAIW